MKRVRNGAIYVFNATGSDIWDRRDYTPENGTLVRATQPYGCPRNGTMGQCYIADLDGKFLGMVALSSLSAPSAKIRKQHARKNA